MLVFFYLIINVHSLIFTNFSQYLFALKTKKSYIKYLAGKIIVFKSFDLCPLLSTSLHLYIKIQGPKVFLSKDRKNVLNVVGIILSQLYNELLSPGNSLPCERETPNVTVFSESHPCQYHVVLLLPIHSWILHISTVILFEPYIFSSSSDSVAISDPIKMFSEYQCSSHCFLALITCFDSWISSIHDFSSHF